MTPDLDALCARSKLDSNTRLLALASAAVAAGDLQLLVASSERLVSLDATATTALREVCLQNIAYCGFPRALQARDALDELLPPAGDDARSPAMRAGAGRAYFGTVYGRHDDKLLARMKELDPVLERLTLSVAYGELLSRPELDGRRRELAGVAALCVLDQPTQILTHAYGALAFGATRDEIIECCATIELAFARVAERKPAAFLDGKLAL